MKIKLLPIIIFFIIISIYLIQYNKHNVYTSTSATYVGVGNCMTCHGGGLGNQYEKWMKSPHAKAYKILTESPNAKKYAATIGSTNPSEDTRCLKCHATGDGIDLRYKTEGVGCEACHGAGSLYFEFSNHASFENRAKAYQDAVQKYGLTAIIDVPGIKIREEVCRKCHNSTRPCYLSDPESRKKKDLTTTTIANFPFQHKIVR